MISSTSSSSPVIVVFGATGQQGGSVIRHLIASDKPYQIKAVTRDPGSAASKSLAEQGVKLVQADLGDTAQVNEAVKGADYVVVSLGSLLVILFSTARTKSVGTNTGNNFEFFVSVLCLKKVRSVADDSETYGLILAVEMAESAKRLMESDL